MEWIDREMQKEIEKVITWLVEALYRFPSHTIREYNQDTGIWRPSNWIWKSLEDSDSRLEEKHVFHLNHE
jgi:hypothetical protein